MSRADCEHYYADRSAAPRIETLVCCGNPDDQGHTGACTSLDAVAKRKQDVQRRLQEFAEVGPGVGPSDLGRHNAQPSWGAVVTVDSGDYVGRHREHSQDHLPLTRAWDLDEVDRCATCSGGGCRDCVE